MKQNNSLEILKNSIFELFINGTEEEQNLCKKLGVLINEFEKRSTNKGIKSRTTSFV